MSDQPVLPANAADGSSTRNRRSFIRRRPRGKVKVACYRGSLDVGENMAIGLADVSESGLRLQVKAEMERGQEVTLLLEGHEHSRPLKSRGRIVWSVAQQDGSFQVGVRMDTYFQYKDIVKMT